MNMPGISDKMIFCSRRLAMPSARAGLFVVFTWFGLLKIIGMSPASGLVQQLFVKTIPFMSFEDFLIGFGIFEVIIGVLFLIRGLERLVIPLLFVHMVTTFGPLVFVPEATWQRFLVPTLEGQYIIKNLVIIACAVGIMAHLHPAGKIKSTAK